VGPRWRASCSDAYAAILLALGKFPHPRAALGDRELARSQNLTVLQGINPDRKRTLLRFLYESPLIDRVGPNQVSTFQVQIIQVGLTQVGSGKANDRVAPEGARLMGDFLNEANLMGAFLSGAIEWGHSYSNAASHMLRLKVQPCQTDLRACLVNHAALASRLSMSRISATSMNASR
jgi:hypothetical protein